MNLGAHISISKGIDNIFERAKKVTANSIQIFTKNNNRWQGRKYTDAELRSYFVKKKQYNPFAIIAHDSYLINLCSPKEEIEQKSIAAFSDELNRCKILKLPYLVMHPGSHLGKGEEWALKKLVENFNQILKTFSGKCKILIETTAGQGTNLGYKFEHLAFILDNVKYPEQFGICVDTCHIFAAGYDISDEKKYQQTFQLFDKIIGINKIKVFHLNDSKNILASKKDRHEHIGKGKIGIDAFRYLVNDSRFKNIPMVLETPKGKNKEMDIENLKILRNLVNSSPCS